MFEIRVGLHEPISWSEEGHLRAGRTTRRVEQIGDGIWLSPVSSHARNTVVSLLTAALSGLAREAGLTATSTPRVRLSARHTLIPDVAVGHFPRLAQRCYATDAVLVADIASPDPVLFEPRLRQCLWAEAGVPFSLIATATSERYDEISLQLFRLEEGKYELHEAAAPGETLTSHHPFPLKIKATTLIDF